MIIAPSLSVLSIYINVYAITIHIMPDTFGYIKEIVPASHASFMALFLLCYKHSDLGSCFPFVVRCPCMNSVFVPAKTEMSKLAIRGAKLVPIGMLTELFPSRAHVNTPVSSLCRLRSLYALL
jgi:hypothetical protein